MKPTNRDLDAMINIIGEPGGNEDDFKSTAAVGITMLTPRDARMLELYCERKKLQQKLDSVNNEICRHTVRRYEGLISARIEERRKLWQQEMVGKLCQLLELAVVEKTLPLRGMVENGLPGGYVPPAGWHYIGKCKSHGPGWWYCFTDGKKVCGTVNPKAYNLADIAHDPSVFRVASHREKEIARLYDVWLASQASPATSTQPGTASLHGSLYDEP